VSFSDYITKGQTVDFELESAGQSPKYMVRVEDVNNDTLFAVILEDDTSIGTIETGTKGTLHIKKRGISFNLYVEVQSKSGSSVLQLKHIPARTHLRVDAFILFKYKKVEHADFERRKQMFMQSINNETESVLWTTQRLLKDDNEQQAAVPNEMITELRSINKKLDFIIKTLGASGEKNIFIKERKAVHISGAGLKFRCSDDYSPGDLLEIEMVLPIASGIYIEFIGEVVRCTQPSDQGSYTHDETREVAVKYAAINEDDREFIIRYVFKRQRELLRSEETGIHDQ